MKELQFSIDIQASNEKVWTALWDDANYRRWAGTFAEGSHAVTDWQEGNKVLFLGDEDSGMYSTIERSIPGKLMTFKHLGVMKDGKEQPLDEETKKWSGARESYTLEENGAQTRLQVTLDTADDHEAYFRETFPKALEKIKEIAEH